MEKYKIFDNGERIGIGNSPIPFAIKVDEHKYLGFGSGIPSAKLEIRGEVLPVLVRPHGERCGCELSYEYSFGLGCPNPTHKLNINE